MFFDPFVRRTFIKINEHEAKCVQFPVRWNEPVSPFNEDEMVYISK
jgi:hypothetical protein